MFGTVQRTAPQEGAGFKGVSRHFHGLCSQYTESHECVFLFFRVAFQLALHQTEPKTSSALSQAAQHKKPMHHRLPGGARHILTRHFRESTSGRAGFFCWQGGGTTHYIVACIQTEALLASVLVVPEESDVRMTAVRAGSYGRCFGGQRHWTSWAVHKLQREMCDRWKLAWGLGSNVGVVRREHPWPNHDNVHGLMHSGRGVRGGGSTTSRV